MAHHVVKSQQPHFDAVWSGEKTFEIRTNDRAYAADDTIEQREWDRELGYGGRSTLHTIGYCSTYAQAPGWVVFALVADAMPRVGAFRLTGDI